jgi:hypothetical protein
MKTRLTAIVSVVLALGSLAVAEETTRTVALIADSRFALAGG